MAVCDHSCNTVSINLSKYSKNLNEFNRKVYIKKLKYEENGCTLYFPDPYSILKENWKVDITMWPNLEYPDLCNYLLNSKGEYTPEYLKNYKSSTAYEYVISGKVSNVYVYQPSGPLRCFRILSADVKPSQKLKEELLKPWVVVKDGGTVQTSHCTCMASFGETCSHVAALLFKVELSLRCGLTTPGTTNSVLSRFKDLQKRKSKTTEKPRKIQVLPRKKISPLTGLDIAKIKQAQPDAVYFTSFVSDDSETD